MPEAKIDAKNWEAAQAWAKENARRLKLRLERRITGLIGFSKVTGVYLRFEPTMSYERRLTSISFSAPKIAEVCWFPRDGAPPETIGELIDSGSLRAVRAPGTGDTLRKRLHSIANINPTFAEAYDEVYARLFPPYEHHELHSDIGEYEEAIQEDESIIRCLKLR